VLYAKEIPLFRLFVSLIYTALKKRKKASVGGNIAHFTSPDTIIIDKSTLVSW